ITGAEVGIPKKLTKWRDEETDTLMWQQRSIVEPSATLPAFGSEMVGYANHYVCEPTREEPIEDSPNKLHIITFCQVPTGYVEFVDEGYTFPGIYTAGPYYYGTASQ